MSLLTAKQWIFDTMYTSYTGIGTGTLSYSRPTNVTLLNLNNYRYVYWQDGSVDCFISGGYFQEPWTFSNSDSTLLYYVPTSFRTFSVYQRIKSLTANRLVIYDSTSSELDVFITEQ